VFHSHIFRKIRYVFRTSVCHKMGWIFHTHVSAWGSKQGRSTRIRGCLKIKHVCGVPHTGRWLLPNRQSVAQFVFVSGAMSTFVPPPQGAAVRRVATFNVSSRREKSLSASISYTTAPPRMFTSKLCDVTPYSLA
jgi:hypothetical protein